MKCLFGLLIIILIIALIILAPFVAIWAISMFGVTPVYDFWHWLAMLVILIMIKGPKFKLSKK